MGSFPSLPATYLEVLKQLESPGASVQSISDVIATDLAVTAKLLQMVNSAFFGLPQKLTNPFEAVAILGVDTVKSLVLGIQCSTISIN
jgi:HD-like signal output (HDOD) protein